MMSHEEVPTTIDKTGNETHPAFGMAHVNRVSSTRGQSMFDSEIEHTHFVSLTINRATRSRELNRDWIYERDNLIEINMSEAQWAQLVSSMNSSGTPVTLAWTKEEGYIPRIPFAPRLALSREEVHTAATKAYEKVNAAFTEVEAKPTKANLRALKTALEHAISGVDYATKTLDEHTENTVAKARADIEAIIANANLRGVNLALPKNLDGAPEIETRT